MERAQFHQRDNRRWLLQQQQKVDKIVNECREEWSARVSKWSRAKKKYPELTEFIEDKFGKDFVN